MSAGRAGQWEASRKGPWLGGLIAALSVAVWLIYEAAAGVIDVINRSLDTMPV